MPMTDRDIMKQALDALAGLLKATPWADHPQEAYSAERAYKALWVRLAQPGQEPPQRKPLTVCEIVDAIQPFYQNRGFAEMAVKVGIDDYRAIEAAHGIKENT